MGTRLRNALADRDCSARVLNDHLPITALLLEDQADEVVKRFSVARELLEETDGEKAERWKHFLCSGIARELGLPAYLEDVATYEHALTALASSASAAAEADGIAAANASLPPYPDCADAVPVAAAHVQIAHFSYDAPAIVAAIESCDRLEPLEEPRACVVLLVKAAGQARPRTLYISPGIEALLGCCDGHTDCAGLATRLRPDMDPQQAAGFAREIFAALEKLRASNVLAYRQTALLR